MIGISLFTIIIILFIYKSISNYIIYKFYEIPFIQYRLNRLKNEYNKNNGKILKYITNIQREYDIYDWVVGKKCKQIGKLDNEYTYFHTPNKNRCGCGFVISHRKYDLVIKKFNKKLKSY